MEKIRVAIAGVGNCASSLVQGLEYYKEAKRKIRNGVKQAVLDKQGTCFV